MYIDTHSHLDFNSFDEDREKVIQSAIGSDVAAIITIGTNIETSRQAVLLAEKYASLYAAVGIHPTDCAGVDENDFAAIEELAAGDKVVAIGEIGLDYHHMKADKETQKKVFRQQLLMARKFELPCIIHNRESHDDVHEILTEDNASNLNGVLHAFSGTTDFLEKILMTNFYISFTGNVTFKKNKLIPLVEATPLERLLLETDSPFLAPAPLRGKRNEPAYVVHTAAKIAEIKGIGLEELARITSENAQALFKLSL